MENAQPKTVAELKAAREEFRASAERVGWEPNLLLE